MIVTVKCSECGKEDENGYTEPIATQMVELQLCFSCNYWRELVKQKDDPCSVRVKGQHFVIGRENAGPAKMRGFGGRYWKIKFFDGRVVETTNLWCQSTIPERFRERLPDNAEFVQ